MEQEYKYRILFKVPKLYKKTDTWKHEERNAQFALIETIFPPNQVYQYSTSAYGYIWTVRCTNNQLLMAMLKSPRPFTSGYEHVL